MSAWIVSKGHIDCLVQSLGVARIIEFRNADEVGRLLWEENFRSVDYRYNEHNEHNERPEPAYTFEGVETPLDAWVVYKQLECYDYQSCEHPEWLDSEAYRLYGLLKAHLLGQLGCRNEEAAMRDPRWNAGPWGIENIREAIATQGVTSR